MRLFCDYVILNRNHKTRQKSVTDGKDEFLEIGLKTKNATILRLFNYKPESQNPSKIHHKI